MIASLSDGPRADTPATAGAPPGHPLRPAALELAAGSMYGGDGEPDVLAALDEGLTPLAALEKAVLPAMKRAPCLVSYSGGRDSSTVLAAATRVARREGLKPPVPITLRFRNAPMSDESAWQEFVVRHLGLSEWEVRELGDEADFVGSVSAALLRRHGVLSPPNAYLHQPLLEAASGGTLLTGLGGDHIFLTWRWQALADLLARRTRPRFRDAMRLVYAAAPTALRRQWELRRGRRPSQSWLRPEARRAVHALAASERAEEPACWREWVGWRMRRRSLAATNWSLGLLAHDVGTVVVHPLIEPRFLATVARAGGRLGFGDRTDAMRALFADALPDPLLARRSKASFDEALWGAGSRDLAESWDGGGVDHDLVDEAALRDEWLSPEPHFRSAMLLQSAWLSRDSHP